MADSATIDVFDRLGIKAEQLKHLAEAMARLGSTGDGRMVGPLSCLAEDLAAEVCRLIAALSQDGARAPMSAG